MHPAFPPDSAPLQIDRVEWVPASPEAVHVHLFGRWRDRPVSEPLVLLVGDAGRRRGFEALPAGPPGVLAAFAVPNELRPRLTADIALQVGAAELELPPAAAGILGEEHDDEQGEVIDRAVLAERRARRAELTEDALSRRAVQAERTVSTLEAQLANLEQRLGTAREERDELESRMAEAQRRLRAAEQREYAEQQRRIESQDELEALRRAQQTEVETLRARVAAANQRAEDLAREVDRARRAAAEAIQQAQADRGALRRAEQALTVRETGTAAAEADLARRLAEMQAAESSLAELHGRADRLAEQLETERAARSRAEAALADEREAAQARVTLLEHELEDRRAAQQRIGGQVGALRTEVERLQAAAAEQARTQEMVGKVEQAAVLLKDRVVDLERRKDAAEREAAQLREVLTARTTELERARIDLEHATRDVEAATAVAARQEAALAQAQLTIDAVRSSAGELQLQLDNERRERAQVEAGLHEELARTRAEGQRALNEAEVELRADVVAQRRAVQTQIASIERHVSGLREQLIVAAATLRDELDGERAARQAAERELAEERGRIEAERATASSALVELERERARSRELEAEIAETQRALREQVERERDQQAARAGREGEVQRLVGDVLRTSASLREGFEREIRQLEGELTERIVAERRGAAEDLAAMEAQMGELRARLESAGTQTDAELQAERTARWLAEAELARERQRTGSEALEVERAHRRRLEAELQTLRAELGRARADAGGHGARDAEARAIADGLSSAAGRLRDDREPLAADELPEMPPRPHVSAPEIPLALTEPHERHPVDLAGPPGLAARPEPAISPEPGEPTDDPVRHEHSGSSLDVGGPEPEAAAPAELRPRDGAPAARRESAWLAPAIARLAALDPQAAARLVVALLPVQRLHVDGDVSYDLTVEELGTFRVLLHPGATTIEPRSAPGGRKEVDFHLAGPAAVLAELAGGGIRRRPRGTRVTGSKRKLRRLLRELRQPVGLADVQRSGASVDPGLVLAALCAAVPAAETVGHAFVCVWDVGGEIWHVRVADGLSPSAAPGLPSDAVAATVRVGPEALLPLLAGLPTPAGAEARVEGNAHAVALLRRWFDQAQGLA